MASTEKECLASHRSGDGVGTQEQDWSRREAPGKGTALKMKGWGVAERLRGMPEEGPLVLWRRGYRWFQWFQCSW